jgi:pimeloyl-ACP methyl ester carboxylesterase
MMPDLPPLPELRFAEVPVASRSRYVGDRLSYSEAGDLTAPPVLLLHGIGANSWHWRFQLAGLADRARLIAWNAPGYLLTDNLRVEIPTGRDYADCACRSACDTGHRPIRRHRQLVRDPRCAVLCAFPSRPHGPRRVHRHQP